MYLKKYITLDYVVSFFYMEIGYAASLDDYLAEYSYTLEMEKKEDSDKPQKVCELAVAISEIYGNKRTKTEILEYYRRTYEG